MENKGNDFIKKLANQAKKRLKDRMYINNSSQVKNEYEKMRNNLRLINGNYMADYKLMLLSDNEDNKLYKKVCSLLEKNSDIISPISELADKIAMNSMNTFERQRYVLMLSSKYKKFKEKYENSKQISI